MCEALYRWCQRIGTRIQRFGFDGQERVIKQKLRRLTAEVGFISNLERECR